MFIDVRLFALLRERAGSDSVTVEVPDGATVRDAVDAVARTPGLADVIGRMSVVMAVNREYADDDARLAEGDELALIPPVSGGATTEAFETGEGYEQFMELVGKHVPAPPNYVELLGMRPLLAEPGHMRFEFQASEHVPEPGGLVQGGFITRDARRDDGAGCDRAARAGPHDPDARAEGQLPAACTTWPPRVRRPRRAHGQVRRVPRSFADRRRGTTRRDRHCDRARGEARGEDVTTSTAHTRVTAEPLSLDALARMVGRPGAGAIVTFQGTTRDVDSLEYEAYREMAEERIAAIVSDAIARHGLQAAAAEHRVGTVALGEASVAVAVSAAHRGEAFAGAREIIDRIKAEAPIWKKEVEEGEGRWVEGTRPGSDAG